MRMVGRTMTGLTGVLSNFFLILLTVSFILLEAKSFPRKLDAIREAPDRQPCRAMPPSSTPSTATSP